MIYTIMTYRYYDEWGPQEYRTVGYYPTLEEAREAVETNCCDIYEAGYYPYAMIEDVRPGLYGSAGSNPIFFEWKDGGYKEVKEPEEFAHLTGFTMG